MIAAMVLVVAGCAYAGVSYYYTSHFFEGTTINGIDSSNRTAYEVEQEIAKNGRLFHPGKGQRSGTADDRRNGYQLSLYIQW